MARKKFEEGFKENAILYCKTHSDKTIKNCAADLGIGYSTLRRWIAQSEEQEQEAVIKAVFGPDEDVIEEVEGAEMAEGSVEEALDASLTDDEQEDANEAEALEDTDDAEEEIADEVASESNHEDALSDAFANTDDDVVVLDAEPAHKFEGVKAQLGDLIETAGSGVSDAVQLLGLYKKRYELKKVQKKLKKEKEKRFRK